jgi:nitrite reductase/ring-hydroxylating ferredoxin subunit/uncharacterized membrane protein
MINWERAISRLTEQPWVDPFSKSVQKSVSSAFSVLGPLSQPVQNFLHGVWLGHPLHPVLTDLPIGAWSVAALLDAAEAVGGDERLAAGADAALGTGLIAALGTALAGFTDWHQTGGEARRIGIIHALSNTSATVLYALSFVSRKTGRRGLGRGLAFGGLGLMTFGAYLGGHLVYAERIGVDQAADQEAPKKFTAVLADADLIDGTPRRVLAGETPVMLLREGGAIYALADTCSHLGCSLAEGQIEGATIRCSCHGSRYALADGRILDGPSTYWQPAYDVRVNSGQIEVRRQRQQPSTSGTVTSYEGKS